ncbi:aldo/keto reductase family protein [Aspergillus tubingensis]|uniref:aldo/keto reductase family protein n=1 Tax=Aspergillus tubingensis TaxID=5068 RepID=UPI0015794DCE|nr:aldo/keto reductase family protein [Aspergillus tubingensis]GFN12497.1 aldo/keto reductase family protein [Aspergillus tubingensis]
MQYPNMQVATAQSSAAHLPATPAPAVRSTIQPTKRIYPRSFFYQRGKYWTTEQVHALNCVSEKNVTPINLLGSSFPTDEKILKSFAKLNEDFITPSKQEILDYHYKPHESPIRKNDILTIFLTLSWIHDLDKCRDDVPPTIDSTLSILGLRMDIFRANLIIDKYSIRYNLAKLNMKGVLPCDGGIFGPDDKWRQCPLVVLLDTYDLSKRQARNNLFSCLLLPMAVKYEQGQKRDPYVSFCITANLSKYRVTRAEAPHTYFEDLRQGRHLKDKLVLKGTREYDWLKEEDRDEFLKVYWGVCSFLVKSREEGM